MECDRSFGNSVQHVQCKLTTTFNITIRRQPRYTISVLERIAYNSGCVVSRIDVKSRSSPSDCIRRQLVCSWVVHRPVIAYVDKLCVAELVALISVNTDYGCCSAKASGYRRLGWRAI